MPAHPQYLQFPSVLCPWIPLLAVGAERAVNISCKHSFLPGSCTHGSYPVSDHTRASVAYWKPEWLRKHWGNGSIKTKITQNIQNMLVSCSQVVKNKGVNVKQLHRDRMNGQPVKKLANKFAKKTSSHLPFNGILVFWSSSPAITWQLAMLNLWVQHALHSGFPLPRWTRNWIKRPWNQRP